MGLNNMGSLEALCCSTLHHKQAFIPLSPILYMIKIVIFTNNMIYSLYTMINSIGHMLKTVH